MGASDGRVLGMTRLVDNGPASRRWNVVILGDGYRESDLGTFQADARSFADALLDTPPFDGMRAAINVFRIDVVSNESGADDPVACGGSGASPATYFDSTFCGTPGVQRLLVADAGLVLSVVNGLVPEWHAILLSVNSPVHGGSGGVIGTFSRTADAREIALHELGHSAFGLADEYEYLVGCGLDANNDVHPGFEPSEANVTRQTNRDLLKWRSLVPPETPVPTMRNPDCTRCDDRPSLVPPGTVGLFEGARYHHCAAFRPEYDCKMRTLGPPFCAVCQERIRQVLAPFLEPSEEVRNPALVQSRFGRQGNFEVVVPSASRGLAHYWRDNDAGPPPPWRRSAEFITPAGPVDAVTLIQSNYGLPGNLEVVARVGDRLAHFFRDSGPRFEWSGPLFFASGVTGTPSLVQGRFGRQGNFEVVVPLATGVAFGEEAARPPPSSARPAAARCMPRPAEPVPLFMMACAAMAPMESVPVSAWTRGASPSWPWDESAMREFISRVHVRQWDGGRWLPVGGGVVSEDLVSTGNSYSPSLVLDGNDIHHNAGDSIQCQPGSGPADGVLVEGNTLHDEGENGVDTSSAVSVHASGLAEGWSGAN